MPQDPRQPVRRLLRQVNGKPYATDEDHEDQTKTVTIGIYDEPLSSSDDQLPSPAKSLASSRPRNTVDTSRPAPRTAQSKGPIKAPRKGAFENNRTDKARRDGSIQGKAKENKRPSSLSPNGKRKREDDAAADNMFDKFTVERKITKPRPQLSRTRNIHGGTPSEPKAKASKVHYTNSSNKGNKKVYTRAKAVPTDSIDDEVSDFSVQERTPSPQKPRKLGAASKKDSNRRSPPPRPIPINLLESLGNSSKGLPPTSSQVSNSQKASLSNIGLQEGSGASTPLSSLPSANGISPFDEGESLHTLEKYFADLPPGASDDRCPLCEEAVEQEHYWEFWKGKKMTVRHQSMFCSEHKKREANVEYTKQGFPSIDWEALPRRIEKHHDRLLAILRDEAPSTYRAQHAERVAAGEDRSVRTLLHKPDAEMDSSTGYYGSRGLRAMMEAISTQLQDELRERSEVDHVVSFGGFATFVLKVLVPELTVSLVMEDLECSEQAAKQYIGESAALGLVVHEEIEDKVELREEDQNLDSESD